MIVQSLNELYNRYAADLEMREKVPHPGMTSEKVEWELIISEEGRLLNIRSCSRGDGKGTNRYDVMLVPEHDGRTSGVKPYFLCDDASYLLGLGDGAQAALRHEKSRALHEEVLSACKNPMAKATLRFFSRKLSEGELDVVNRLSDLLSGNMVISVSTASSVPMRVHEQEEIIDAWDSYRDSHREESVVGQCSITGEKAVLARLFPKVTGFAGAQSSGAALISFNLDSFESYGKTQTYNASISERVAFGAGMALKMLLADPERHVRLGNTTFTFWSDRPAADEDCFLLSFIDERHALEKAEDSGLVKRIDAALEGIKKGHSLGEGFNASVRYYILGISPNAARLSVRFFETETLGEIARRYGQYLGDIDMVDVRSTSLFQLLRQCAVQGKYDNIPSTIVNPCVRAMLSGARFPRSLLGMLLSRMRADHGSNNTWDMGQRASLIKACLTRDRRLLGVCITRESELGVALNRENTSTGYLIGRLFAVMERAQSAALGITNVTIRDKYIGSASVTPARVMPTLMHGCQNHLGALRKKNPGMSVVLERELDEIVGRKFSDDPYPATLSMEEQGEFFVGYYQERVDLWTSHKNEGDSSDIKKQAKTTTNEE